MTAHRRDPNIRIEQLEAEVELLREALIDLLAQVCRLSMAVPNKGITRFGPAQAVERDIDRISERLKTRSENNGNDSS